MKINAQLVVDDGEQSLSVSLSSECLAELVDFLPDNEAFKSIFGYLSRHTDSRVRAAVAQKKFLPRSALVRLIDDPVVKVVSKLLAYLSPQSSLTAAQLLAICQRDASLARKVAMQCKDLACDDAVLEFLETHPDESVRSNLIRFRSSQRAVLQRMMQRDTDVNLREAASEALKKQYGS